MFGPRLSKIFANRWTALWWAASILFLTWQMVPAPDEHSAPAHAPVASHAHANPWDLATPSGKDRVATN